MIFPPDNKDLGFSPYREFTEELRRLVNGPLTNESWNDRVNSCLDGTASTEVCRLVALPVRRKFGVFFTGSKLAEKLIDKLQVNPTTDFIYDPAVGAGDLLLAVARRLPIQRTLIKTLETWGHCLAGTDIQAEFVEAAKLRLVLLARQRHGATAVLPKKWEKYFPYIYEGNGLFQSVLYARATHLIMNPPFSISSPQEGCEWTGGRVSDAARFVINALEQTKPGACLLAILPDVLRSGSFQCRWRERVSDLAEVTSLKRHGVFDASADIDVFLLKLKRRPNELAMIRRWPVPTRCIAGTIGDFFDVHVGRVVPHRDPETGPEYPYIHPRRVPTWQVMSKFPERRCYEGLVYKPPFVVIRRTSRPGHPYRATATVISGKNAIAVENHFIVCEPKNHMLDVCMKLMEELKTEAVNDFLNACICCRHLTIGAVSSIPFHP